MIFSSLKLTVIFAKIAIFRCKNAFFSFSPAIYCIFTLFRMIPSANLCIFTLFRKNAYFGEISRFIRARDFFSVSSKLAKTRFKRGFFAKIAIFRCKNAFFSFSPAIYCIFTLFRMIPSANLCIFTLFCQNAYFGEISRFFRARDFFSVSSKLESVIRSISARGTSESRKTVFQCVLFI